jgi:hypothetical protein
VLVHCTPGLRQGALSETYRFVEDEVVEMRVFVIRQFLLVVGLILLSKVALLLPIAFVLGWRKNYLGPPQVLSWHLQARQQTIVQLLLLWSFILLS